MTKMLIGIVGETSFRFDPEWITSAVRSTWSNSVLCATDLDALLLQADMDSDDWLEMNLLTNRNGGALDGGSTRRLAQMLSLLTHHPGFPSDGAVVVLEWANEYEYPLLPNMTTDELLAVASPTYRG